MLKIFGKSRLNSLKLLKLLKNRRKVANKAYSWLKTRNYKVFSGNFTGFKVFKGIKAIFIVFNLKTKK